MTYALRPVIDTWLKLSTAQGSTLPEAQRQLIRAGTLLPLAKFDWVGNEHIQITLGQDAQNQPVQFKGQNTWYVYAPAVQILQNGQVIHPSPNPSAYLLKPLIDTWLKLSTAQGSTLLDSQRQLIRAGELLPLESYKAAAKDHLQITLGKDAQGKPLQFKNQRTWYVYDPAVEIITATAPTPTPIPVTPSPFTMQALVDTWLKLSTAQSSTLPDDQRQFISKGTVLPVESYQVGANDHLKIQLGRDGQGRPVQFKGKSDWQVYRPSVRLLKDGKPVALPTPRPVPTPVPTPSTGQNKLNAKGLRLLKAFEGLELKAYQDAVGVWTIGYGTTSGVKPGMVITEAQAEELLKRDLNRFERAVDELVQVPLTSDQFSALVTFAYNVGEGALANSTLLRLLNQRDYQGAAEQLLRWDKAGGRALPGLTRRRRAERSLFLGQDYTVFL